MCIFLFWTCKVASSPYVFANQPLVMGAWDTSRFSTCTHFSFYLYEWVYLILFIGSNCQCLWRNLDLGLLALYIIIWSNGPLLIWFFFIFLLIGSFFFFPCKKFPYFSIVSDRGLHNSSSLFSLNEHKICTLKAFYVLGPFGLIKIYHFDGTDFLFRFS